jgi:hypothetical protein
MATFLGHEIAQYILLCPKCNVEQQYYFLGTCPECRFKDGDDINEDR